jgi:hypothetical protein
MSRPPEYTILELPWGFRFFTDSSGSYYLEVLCGAAGIFEVCIRLTEDELSRYREFGNDYIEKLARDVAYSPSTFIQRQVSRRG